MDKRIGAQLFTLREFCQTKEGLEESFAKLEKIGYKAAQVSAIGPIPAEDVKEIADRHGITIACTHRPLDDYLNHMDEMIAYHKTIGCDIAGLGYAEFGENPDEMIEKMNWIADELKKADITFAYHNHFHEFAKLPDGRFLMDYLAEKGRFDFILDVYWLAYAGVNPADYIRKLGKRAVVIHFKDLAVIGHETCMAEVMEGNLDWDSIIKASEEAGARWAMVEQDVCKRDPFDCLKTSYDNLKTKGFC